MVILHGRKIKNGSELGDERYKMNLVSPIFLNSNHVQRSYTGGKLLREFLGETPNEDNHFPEDWLVFSRCHADGKIMEEGTARIQNDSPPAELTLLQELDTRGETILGPAHIANFGLDLGMVCKLLDPAERLPIECFPDGIACQKIYGVEGEGAKVWCVINTREVQGQLPYILAGFKQNAGPEAFAQAVHQQNTETMVSMLHKIPVRKGETFFIPAGMPHALGPGVLVFETRDQESYSVIPEQRCGEKDLTSTEMWGQLTVDQGLSIFDYTGQTVEEVLKCIRVTEHVLLKSDEGMHAELVGSERTGGFSLWRIEVVGRFQIKLPRPFGLVLCTGGEGRINWADGTREFKAGEHFLQPYTVPWVEYIAFGRLALIIALPPMV